ncbi:hypothetical protein E2C01_013007 [Portunus trituberculatus]|uniref:Uncharacterized protein n=1 Tax=Portunus trituberculatus TaxID=210409 RepID=A0A5B7DFY6_PORTR|nr:hypothetical protein [Portunus trituberculatus]
MLTPNPASEFLSGELTRNVPRSDCSLNDNPKCLDTSLNFYINICNIRSLRSNFQSVEHHLFSTKLLLFFNETQLSEATDSSPFSVPSYFLYSYFRSKAGSCVYVRNLTCSHAHALESFEFEGDGDLRRYYADFPWNDYCFRVKDPSLWAEHITEVIVSGMELPLLHKKKKIHIVCLSVWLHDNVNNSSLTSHSPSITLTATKRPVDTLAHTGDTMVKMAVSRIPIPSTRLPPKYSEARPPGKLVKRYP